MVTTASCAWPTANMWLLIERASLAMSKKNIEGRVAETLLQDKLRIVIGKRTYTIPQPTIGTLAMVAEDIAALPEFSPEKNITEILAGCVHAEKVARILAILVIGSKRIKRPGLLCLVPGEWKVKRMTRRMMDNLTSGQIWNGVTAILTIAELDDFFALTTFLRTVSLSAREVGENPKTTASGQ